MYNPCMNIKGGRGDWECGSIRQVSVFKCGMCKVYWHLVPYLFPKFLLTNRTQLGIFTILYTKLCLQKTCIH